MHTHTNIGLIITKSIKTDGKNTDLYKCEGRRKKTLKSCHKSTLFLSTIPRMHGNPFLFALECSQRILSAPQFYLGRSYVFNRMYGMLFLRMVFFSFSRNIHLCLMPPTTTTATIKIYGMKIKVRVCYGFKCI